MRRGHLLFSALHFFMTIALLGVAGLFLSLAYIPGARLRFIEVFSSPHAAFATTGYCLLGTGVLLIVFLYFLHRKTYLNLTSGVSLDQSLAWKEVELFWAENFPEEKRPEDLYFNKGKIEIIAPLPNDIETLEEIEARLAELFKRKFGYEKSFHLKLTK